MLLSSLLALAAFAPPQSASVPQAPPCVARRLPTPVWRTAAPVTPTPGCASSAWPYGAQFTPDGARLYAPLFGGYVGSGSTGCRLARLDPTTFATLAQIPTGESPQELAFLTTSSGALLLGFVSNSSGSSVTVFDAADNVVATVAIPFAAGGFGTAFPGGMAVSPDGSHVYVATLDGSGTIHAIDTATLTLDPTAAIQLGIDHTATRMLFARNRLVIMATESLPGWSGSTAKVMAVDIAHPQVVQERVLATDNTFTLYPSTQDCAIDCDNTVWVAGFDMGAQVFGLEPSTLSVRCVVPTHTSNTDGKFQALGLSSDGMLVVGDSWTSELAVINARARRFQALLDTSLLPTSQMSPQEIAFAPGTHTFVVPWAATHNLGVYDF